MVETTNFGRAKEVVTRNPGRSAAVGGTAVGAVVATSLPLVLGYFEAKDERTDLATATTIEMLSDELDICQTKLTTCEERFLECLGHPIANELHPDWFAE